MDVGAMLGGAEQTRIEEAYQTLLDSVPATMGTTCSAERAGRAWRELTCGYTIDVPGLLTAFDAEGHDEMVLVRHIPFYSLCEHHLLPFHGHADVGYIPDGRIVGLSKIARVVDAYARRLQVQERLTDQIADVFDAELGARGVICVVTAEHLCMTMRGVMKPGSTTTTSVVRGLLKTDARARSEALALFAQP